MKAYLFTSPLRHWKNGDKDMALKTWLLSVGLSVVGLVVGLKAADYLENKRMDALLDDLEAQG